MPWLLTICLLAPSLIEGLRADFQPAFHDHAPTHPADTWRVPFQTEDRTDIRTLRPVSRFGAARTSIIKGHFHTGVDLVPRKPRPGPITVFPIAHGVVVSIHLSAPHTTVVVKHKLPDNTILFTAYKHLAAYHVQTGDQVTPQTPLGRLFTPAEAKALGGPYDHLHLEVRKKFDDYGVASWATMTKAELGERFYKPFEFLRRKLAGGQGRSLNPDRLDL